MADLQVKELSIRIPFPQKSQARMLAGNRSSEGSQTQTFELELTRVAPALHWKASMNLAYDPTDR
jgi:hypothetical protein